MIVTSILILFSVIGITTSQSIYCYECDSSNDFSCTEFWDPTLPVTEQYYTNCSHVYDAKYCVKMTGIFNGMLGTKRFCSSRDWGNYCEYIERPGDIQEYRSCIFTCWTNSCNGGRPVATTSSNHITTMTSAAFVFSLSRFFEPRS